MKPNTELAEELFGKFLNAMGFDWQNDDAMKQTPKRFVKSYLELFSGHYTELGDLTEFPNTHKYSQLIRIDNITVKSMCAHHLLPFHGVAHVAYLPKAGEGGGKGAGKILGISKFNRIVAHYARRPQTQEELTEQIADHIQKLLQPAAVGVMIECSHMCSFMRGVNDTSTVTTTALRGLMHEDKLLQEWMSKIK